MKLKTLVITVVVLALLCFAANRLARPPAPPAADARIGQTVLAPAAVDQAAQVRISDAGKTVLLVRAPDGTWKDASYYNFSADFSKLSTFINDFTTAKLQRLVTRNPDRLARLGLNDSKVELLDASGRVLATVTLGKNADSGGRFLRFDREPQAYLANLTSWLDSDPKSWADAALLNVKADDVARVEVGFAAGGAEAAAAPPKGVLANLDKLTKFGAAAATESVTATRSKKDEPWAATKPRPCQRLSADKISSVLTTLGGLRFSDSSDPADPAAVAAKAHARTFQLTTFGGTTYTLVIGRQPEEKKLKPPPPAPKPAPGAKPAPPAKPAAPEYDTVPAGPVFAWVTSSDPRAPINAQMKQRAFQIDEYSFTSLPQKPDELFEAAPKK